MNIKKKDIQKIIIILIIFISVGLIGFSINKRNTPNQESEIILSNNESKRNLQLTILTGMVYRHLIAYGLVCKEAGLELKKYPDYFAKKYKSHIQEIDASWKKKASSLEYVLQHFDPKIYKDISSDIKKELIDIERVAIKHILAHDKKISISELKWGTEEEKKLNLKDACFLFDDQAEFFLDDSSFEREFSDRIQKLK